MANNRRYADESEDDFLFDEDNGMVDGELTEDEAEAAEDHRTEQATKDHSGHFRLPVWSYAVMAVFLLVVIGVAWMIQKEHNKPSTDAVDLYTYLQIGRDEIVLFLDDEKMDTEVLYRKGSYYVENSFLQQYISNKFYFDEELQEVLLPTASEIYHIPMASNEYYNPDGSVAASSDSEYAIRIGDEIYIRLDFALEMVGYNFNCRIDHSPERIHLYSGRREYHLIRWSEAADTITVRVNPTVKAVIVATWENNTEEPQEDHGWWYVVQSDQTSDKWTYVRSMDGRFGYVRTAEIADPLGSTVTLETKDAPEYPNQLRPFDILLGWHGVYDKWDNTHVKELVEAAAQMNVISPTWYMVSDNAGNMENSFEDADYVRYVHEKGLEIWPLISDFNFPYDDSMDEATFLKSYSARTQLIANMMAEAAKYGYDGWNIDFEHVPKECGFDYIEFIRELSIACREAGLVLSTDNYVPRDHTKHYMRTDQGECIDYFIVMGYDEHWGGCEEAGSTASLGFVEEGLDDSLALVPADKVIMGVPFYTRLWKETTNANGELELTSVSYTMRGAQEKAAALGLSVVWDDSVSQHVATGRVDGIYYSVWLEDLDSMTIRLNAIRKRNIAGIAAWSLGYEEPGTWSILAQ